MQDGFLPICCVDDTLRGTALEKWGELVADGAKNLGKDWTRVNKYKEFLEEVGFEDVVETRFAWPIGTWARGERMKMLGTWTREDVLGAIQGVSMAVMTRGLGMSSEEVEVFLVDVRKDIMNKGIHAYFPM